MSETIYVSSNIPPVAALLQQRGLTVPPSVEAAAQVTTYGYANTGRTLDTEPQRNDTTLVSDTPLLTLRARTNTSPGNAVPSNELTEDLYGENPTEPLSVIATAPAASKLTSPTVEMAVINTSNASPTPHRREGFNRQALNPMYHVRGLAGRLAARTSVEKAKHAKNALRIFMGAGSIAVAATSAYLAHKGYTPFMPDNATSNIDAGTWHDGALSVNPNEHLNLSGGGSNVLPITPDQPPVPSEPAETFRNAIGHDASTGRASNVTDWSRQAIYKEALKEGLSQQQATSLSRNHDNILDANQAFFGDNKYVGKDPDHFLFAGKRYETTAQHDAAGDIIDQWKADHDLADKRDVQQPAAPATVAKPEQPHPTPSAELKPEATPSASVKASPTPSETEVVFTPSDTYDPEMKLEDKVKTGLVIGVVVLSGAGVASAAWGAYARRRNRRFEEGIRATYRGNSPVDVDYEARHAGKGIGTIANYTPRHSVEAQQQQYMTAQTQEQPAITLGNSKDEKGKPAKKTTKKLQAGRKAIKQLARS